MDEQSTGGIGGFISDHPGLAVGGAVVILFIGYMVLNKGKTASQTSSATAQGQHTTTDLTGLTTDSNGNPVVYVPTQTLFTTNNNISGSNVNSAGATTASTSVSAPSATSITAAAPVATSNQTTNTTSTSIVTITHPTTPPTPVPVPTPPVPKPPTGSNSNVPPRTGTPAPTPKHKGGLVWDQNYTIKSGDSLSRIASTLTQNLRRAGMPGSESVTYNDIYGHNTVTINRIAGQHGTPIKNPTFPTPAAINNIFPGEIIIVPRWNPNAN